MKPPAVYKAICAITAAFSHAGIAKDRVNEQEGWTFRGIDDVYNALSPLLAKHKLCILPRILERECHHQRQGVGESTCHVALKVAFDFISALDGSCHSIEIWGEGTDRSDKATNKAIAAAYKYAAFQVFCIPIAGHPDGDAETIQSRSKRSGVDVVGLEPVQGWAQWALDFSEMIDGCQTEDALRRLQTTYRRELHSLSATDASRYHQIGDKVAEIRERFAKPPTVPKPKGSLNRQADGVALDADDLPSPAPTVSLLNGARHVTATS